MKITFWGTRGSLPSPLDAAEFRVKAKRLLMNAHKINLSSEATIDAYLDQCHQPYAMTFGGNTPCVEITHEGQQLILDCGSGLAVLGKDMVSKGFGSGGQVTILQTHTHWDHMMGFPFFPPAYIPGVAVDIYGVHPNLRERFAQQMDLIHFPITMDDMKGALSFHQLEHDSEITIGCFTVKNKGLHHPGGSYAYRITAGGKSVVFATDGEYKNLNEEFADYIGFYRDADALIFDAMYATLEKTIEKENFGHSTPVIGINIALTAGVKTLFLFHHDPDSNDSQIIDAYNQAAAYLAREKGNFPGAPLTLVTAYDSLVWEV